MKLKIEIEYEVNGEGEIRRSSFRARSVSPKGPALNNILDEKIKRTCMRLAEQAFNLDAMRPKRRVPAEALFTGS